MRNNPWQAALSALPTDGCVPWLGRCSTGGYGQSQRMGERVAHRAVYRATVGAIPDGMELDHLCDNPPCVNPAHLEPVTPMENTARKFIRAYGYDPRIACKKGHPRTPENTYVPPRHTKPGRKPQRTCRKCTRIALDASRARQRARASGVSAVGGR